MKGVVVSLLLGTVIVPGCKGGCVKPPAASLEVPREIEPPATDGTVPDYWMKALSAGRLDLAVSAFEEDAAWIAVDSYPKRFEGRREIRGRLDAYKRLCPDGRLAPEFVIPVWEDTFLVIYTFTGTHTGSVYGIPASGRRVGAKGAQFERIEGLKVREVTDFFNPVTLLVQAGVVEGRALPVPSPAESAVHVVQQFYAKDTIEQSVRDALASTDPAAALAPLMAEHVVYTDHMLDRTARGPGPAARALASIDGFTDLRFDVVESFHPTDRVVVHLVWSGRYLGAPGREHAKGKVVSAHRLDVYTIDGDRFVSVESFGNPLDFNYALDLERPEPPQKPR